MHVATAGFTDARYTLTANCQKENSSLIGGVGALLLCIDRRIGFYQRLEWAEVPGEVLIDQPDGKVPCPFHVMTLAFKPEFQQE